MKTSLPLLCALLGMVVLVQCDEGFSEGQGQGEALDGGDLPGALRTLREAAESHTRLKRACSWWFQWKVTGARVDHQEVTDMLDELFRKVCNKFGK